MPRGCMTCEPCPIVVWICFAHYVTVILATGMPSLACREVIVGRSRALASWLPDAGLFEAIVVRVVLFPLGDCTRWSRTPTRQFKETPYLSNAQECRKNSSDMHSRCNRKQIQRPSPTYHCRSETGCLYTKPLFGASARPAGVLVYVAVWCIAGTVHRPHRRARDTFRLYTGLPYTPRFRPAGQKPRTTTWSIKCSSGLEQQHANSKRPRICQMQGCRNNSSDMHSTKTQRPSSSYHCRSETGCLYTKPLFGASARPAGVLVYTAVWCIAGTVHRPHRRARDASGYTPNCRTHQDSGLPGRSPEPRLGL
jgi:hypothetical protein